MRDLRLLVPAATAWAAAWSVVAAPDAGVAPWLFAGACWAVAGLTTAVLAGVLLVRRRDAIAIPRRGRARLIVPFAATALVSLAACALVSTAAALGLDAREGSPLQNVAAEHGTAAVVIEVTTAPRPATALWFDPAADPPVRLEGRLVAVDGRAVPAVPVTATGSAPADGLDLGAHVAFDARVAALPAAEGSAFRMRPVTELEITAAPPPWLGWSAGLRSGFAAAASALGGDGGALVPGLAIGDTAAVGDELDAAMKSSSLSHLTAVSGANCAIVTAAAFALAAALGSARWIRVGIALLALIGFIVLVTPESSVVRAGAMAVVVLASIASGRQGGGIAALALAVVALLTLDPWFSRDYGFALSVCATAGLLLLAAPLTGALARVMPVPLAALLGVPLAAQLACQPVLVLLDPGLALYGVPANLLAAPAAPLGTVVGLVGCLLLPALPSVGFACLQLAWLPASWIALVAHGASAMPLGRLPWLPDAPGAVLLAACTAVALWLALSRRRRPGLRASAWTALILAVAIPFGILVGAPAVSFVTKPGEWDVAACDIGQGDAVLLRSAGETALIDTGPEPAALQRCLALLGIDRIDLLVVTHWDADHAGGAAAVVGRVETVIHGPLDGERSSRVLGPLTSGGAAAIEVVAGHRGALGDARWKVVWPKPGAIPGNDASVVLDVDAPGYRGVFLGDLGEGAQSRLLSSAHLGAVDLVKVAHHGSADQSESLYDELGATVGLIGVGADNGYGHPTDRLLDVLTDAGTALVRTDRAGTAVLTANNGGFELWTERGAGGVGARP